MKSVLISIHPKWCELIANGKKTVEVRKTRPKIETPFKVYIYCTRNNHKHALHTYINSGYGRENFGTIGHWRSGKDTVDVNSHLPAYRYNAYLAEGKVIGEFVCDKIDTVMSVNTPCMVYFTVNDKMDMFFSDISCLDVDELGAYIGFNKEGYGLHISDLVIYDQPRELREFYIADLQAVRQCSSRRQAYYSFTDTGYIKNGFYCEEKDDFCFGGCKRKVLTRPPQSWCYVDPIT